MTITRVSAIAIFVALGFKTADKWDTDRINKRLSQIADQVDDDAVKGVEDDDTRKSLQSVLKALGAGETVELEAEKKAKTEDEPEKPKAKKAKAEPAAEEGDEPEKPKSKAKAEPEGDDEDDKPKAKAKAEKSEKKAKAEPAKDKFGNREGSQAANINAALAKKWTTVAEVAKATKLSEARVRSHFKYLEGKKIAEYDAEKGARLLK